MRLLGFYSGSPSMCCCLGSSFLAKSQGSHRAHFILFPSEITDLCCLSENSCFVYFVQFPGWYSEMMSYYEQKQRFLHWLGFQILKRPHTPIFWPPNGKNWLNGKDPDAGKARGEGNKKGTEDEMVGWHLWLDGHEFEEAPQVSNGQGSLACCSPWGLKQSDMTKPLNWL